MAILKRPKVIEKPRSKANAMQTMSKIMSSRMPKPMMGASPYQSKATKNK